MDGGAVAAVLAGPGRTAPAPSTLHGYRDHVERYLIPSIGRITLADLTGKRLQACFNLLSRQRTRNGTIIAAATVDRVRATLRSALNAAVREGLIAANPLAQVRLDKPVRPYPVIWTDERVEAWRRDGIRPPAAVWTLRQLITFLTGVENDRLAPFVERFLDRIALDAAETVRRAMAGGIDGFPCSFLARQLVLRAMRMVLVPPATATGGALDPALEASLADIDQETAAVLLVHLAGDALCQERQPEEARFCGTAESLAMEMNANSLFNDRDDNGDLLARYRML